MKFASDVDYCKTDQAMEAALLSCAADLAADAASSLTLYAAETEFRRDAEGFAMEASMPRPEKLIDVLLSLAKSDNLWLAEQALDRVDRLFRTYPALLNTARRYQTTLARARISDARLDQKSAMAALGELATIAVLNRAKLKSPEEINVIGPEFKSLIGKHVRGHFCTGCGDPIAASVKRWIHAALTQNEGRNFSNTEYGEYEYLLIAFSAPASTFTPTERKSYVRRFLRLYAGQGYAAMVKKILQTQDETTAAIVISLANYIGGTYTDDAIAALLERDEKRQSQLLSGIFKRTIEDGYEQFGADNRIADFLDTSARYLQATGYRNAARVALEVLAERKPILRSPDLPSERLILADVYAPGLARLASVRLASGDVRAATRHLDEASSLIAAKLRQEWTTAGEGTILALRNLAPALRLIAQKRNEIVVKGGLSRNNPDHDALFRAMQAAMFGEMALTLELAGRRRLLADETTRNLQRTYLEASAQAERAKQIAAYLYEAGDVDGALARHKRTTAAQSDAARRAVESRLHGGLTRVEDIETVALADARARLQDKEALVLLHVGSHGLYGFLLDRSGRSLAWRSDVRAQVLENLVRSLRSSGDISRSLFPPFSFADAAKLHGLIFGPIEAALDDYRKLVIVGDGPLQAMPYGLLLRRPLDQQASDGTALRAANPKWLIRSHAIALLPSVRTLVAQRANREPIRVGKPFLGVGNPQLADAGDLRSIDIAGAFKGSAGELADVSFLRRLVSLPETADELRTIAKLLAAPPDALVLGAQANERTVRAMDLSDYRIVAFATHGALAGEVNGTSEPGLVLTPPTEASREDDGFLSLSEIIGLRLNADLVILSACNTATSDGRPKAEGLSGLARGFFAAGAQSLLATHWAIPSTSAVKITTGLIAHRAERPDADWAYALRATTLALIDGDGPSEWAHPAYWAGFAAIGVLPLGR